jgi:ATP-dependent protease ClpP protease subunit
MNVLKTLVPSLLLALLVSGSAFAASVTVTLPNGSVWRGQTDDRVTVEYRSGVMKQKMTGVLVKSGDLYIVVREDGGTNEVPIFRTDLISLSAAAGSGDVPSGDAADDSSSGAASSGEAKTDSVSSDSMDASDDSDGVFYLPMSGQVGVEMRPEEIEAIIAQADEVGPGQTIVIDIESGGGMVVEYIVIAETIMEAKKRHSFVAWVGEAISAAAGTALACDRIVFKSHSRLGAITMHSSGKAVSDEKEEKWITMLKEVLRSSNYSEFWARPMVRNDSFISYIKDPVTGDCEFFDSYQNEPGEVVLSKYGENCVLGAESAMDCCLAYGRADNTDELAVILDMSSWNDIGTGQKLHDDWHQTVERCDVDIRKTKARLGMLGEYDQIVQIRKTIEIYNRWIRWWKRAPNKMLMSGVPPVESLEQMIEDLERQLRQITRGGG